MNLKHLERCALHIQSLYEIYQQPEKTQKDIQEAFLQKNAAQSCFYAFAMEEITRLQQKIWNMHIEKIESISYTVLGENFKPLEEHEREL
jgi:hypothetical protein